MSKERIAELLHQLQVELSDADDVDPELNERLHAATEEIRHVLDQDDLDQEAVVPPPGVITQLREAANRFEDSHPTITNTVGRIADALAQMGI